MSGDRNAHRLLSQNEVDPGSTTQVEQHQIMDEVHRQQNLLSDIGKCSRGCSVDCIVMGWEFSFKKQSAEGLTQICKYTRMQCPSLSIASVVNLYSKLNKHRQPLIGVVTNQWSV